MVIWSSATIIKMIMQNNSKEYAQESRLRENNAY